MSTLVLLCTNLVKRTVDAPKETTRVMSTIMCDAQKHAAQVDQKSARENVYFKRCDVVE